ncbi:tRNA (adenosine(37)-N6)-threonylcarbamoyltransferase complex dimerization subunit type 1 TsaB [Alkalibacillus almallahensis]|uniref:tRNA (adenosine(37)-N6)-threonylcarbamoyltransferase complex dimerization subunit type 1 TsaB n=1 Tax=Alkalibacillus almallahensis TaxID=1379154 RepID=UPI00141EEF99|nr:tRNA (adenosine(37)-N6)-threonylcarbamoyltransferase complex dimerization subunit type 1 TsaB [Alkalibacillus almallahensis]NIK11768.1 tRNA threonylcarbamoyladenosine biosynthesis protein TsaB [Alkalibacillus almallahensis]
MNVLAIDTSNQPMSVAVLKEGVLAAELTINMKRNHSIQVMPAVDYVMNQADLKPKDLQLVAIAEGPGSYTGLRIGMSSAKSLAWSLDIPIVAISSLKVLAAQVTDQDKLIAPFFDARRGNVYAGLYERTTTGIETIQSDRNVAMTDWLEVLKETNRDVIITSSTNHQFTDEIYDILGQNVRLIDPVLQYPKASMLAYLAMSEESISVHALAPQYHRMVEAEAKWLEKQKER